MERVDITEAGPGEIVSVAGLPEVTIGDTITEPGDPRPLPRLDVDAPTLSMTFGVNTSPLGGRDGKYVTSRQIKARLEKEVLGNVSIEVHPTDSGDTFEVRGRGELQLAVLIEQMRREGYELTVSRPEVILRTVGGEVQEPYERVTIDIPPDYIGEVQQALAGRKGRLEQMTTDADGRVRMEFVLPVRGLIGYRGQLLTDTRGTALLHQIGEGYGPWAGEVTHRTNGVLISDRTGTSNAYGLFNLQERSELFIGSGRGRLRGDDRRRERSRRRHGRQRLQGEEAHQHPDALPRRGAPADAAAAAHARERDRVHRHGRAGRGDPRPPSGCASGCSPGTTATASAAAPTTCRAPSAPDPSYAGPSPSSPMSRRDRATRRATARMPIPASRTHSHGMPVSTGAGAGAVGAGVGAGVGEGTAVTVMTTPLRALSLVRTGVLVSAVPERGSVPDRPARDVIRLGCDGARVIGGRGTATGIAPVGAIQLEARSSRPC